MNCFRTERVGFKTAVQKAAFKDDKVCHTFKFTSVTSVCCFSLSPSCLSVPPASLLFLPAPFFTSSTVFHFQYRIGYARKPSFTSSRCPSKNESEFRPYSRQPKKIREIFIFIFFYIWALENKTRNCISRWDRFKCADQRLECEQRNKDYFAALRSLAVICYWALLHSSIKKLSVITPLQSTFNG